jgi:hypothetical protein
LGSDLQPIEDLELDQLWQAAQHHRDPIHHRLGDPAPGGEVRIGVAAPQEIPLLDVGAA